MGKENPLRNSRNRRTNARLHKKMLEKCGYACAACGCDHTLREQWMIHRKLILVLDDHAIRGMLIAKSDGRAPEEIVGQKIEHFRLSM